MSLGLTAILLFCASGASCTRSIRSPFAPWTPPAPEVLVVGSSLDQVLAAVNQNAARIQSYQTNNASIKVPGMPGIPALNGKIAAQRPGRLRLMASSLVAKEFDLGSNDELYWFWVGRNQPPAVYFARHDQFVGSAAQQLMPVEPQWLLDALGFVEFKPTDVHEGPTPAGEGKVEIKSVVQSRTGPMTKRTVIDSRFAHVLEQHVYDSSGTLVASAVARSHHYYEKAGVSLPQEIDVKIPASELSLSIDVGTVEINALVDNPQLFAMPSDAPPHDLGTIAPGGGVPPIGQQLTQADWYGPRPATGSPPVAINTMQSAAGSVGAAPLAVGSSQVVTPGGVAMPPADPFEGGAGASMQRLPAGGVAAHPLLAR